MEDKEVQQAAIFYEAPARQRPGEATLSDDVHVLHKKRNLFCSDDRGMLC